MKKNMRRLVPGFFVCLSVAVGCLLGPLAQYVCAQTEKASISGRITDQSNAVVPDAEVEIRNTDTGIVASTKTNDQGVYAFPSLPPGNYIMNVHKQGFRTVSVTDIKLYVQDNISRNFVMQVGSSAESVTVVAQSEAGLVNTNGSELGTVITQQAIHELPLNGRNFTQLLTLTPGATPISTAQSSGVGTNDLAVLGVPTATVSQPSIQGQFNRSNLYMLDGVINTELNTSTYVIPPIVDAIQEFKVQSHDDRPEYGGVLGGVVSVVTKSGGNQLHGSAWEFVRNNATTRLTPATRSGMRCARLLLHSTKINSVRNSTDPSSFQNCITVVTVHSSSLDTKAGGSPKPRSPDIEFLRTRNFPATFQSPFSYRMSTIQRQRSQTRAILASLLAPSLLRHPIRVLQISTPLVRTQLAVQI